MEKQKAKFSLDISERSSSKASEQYESSACIHYRGVLAASGIACSRAIQPRKIEGADYAQQIAYVEEKLRPEYAEQYKAVQKEATNEHDKAAQRHGTEASYEKDPTVFKGIELDMCCHTHLTQKSFEALQRKATATNSTNVLAVNQHADKRTVFPSMKITSPNALPQNALYNSRALGEITMSFTVGKLKCKLFQIEKQVLYTVGYELNWEPELDGDAVLKVISVVALVFQCPNFEYLSQVRSALDNYLRDDAVRQALPLISKLNSCGALLVVGASIQKLAEDVLDLQDDVQKLTALQLEQGEELQKQRMELQEQKQRAQAVQKALEQLQRLLPQNVEQRQPMVFNTEEEVVALAAPAVAGGGGAAAAAVGAPAVEGVAAEPKVAPAAKEAVEAAQMEAVESGASATGPQASAPAGEKKKKKKKKKK